MLLLYVNIYNIDDVKDNYKYGFVLWNIINNYVIIYYYIYIYKSKDGQLHV